MQLGDITLDRPIGRGGMAVVWRGEWGGASLPVAVKILDATDDPVQRRRFNDEVRAVARLRHRHIVDVIEMGVVPESVADGGLGLRPGSPWLAMEFVAGGTLREAAPRLTWSQARSVLQQLLGALAHAHARGVIHRDLKPANLLVTRVNEEPFLHVSDFGIAYTRGAHERDSEFEGRVAGTPRYMAPEQIEGRWRDHGPWTDLYAVGCLAYWLVSGHTPFGGESVEEILRGQLYGAVDTLEESHPVPNGFDRWVGGLLRKSASDRFRSAADASFGLAALGGTGHHGRLWGDDAASEDADITQAFSNRDWKSLEKERFERATLRVKPGDRHRPPLPRTWRANEGDTSHHPGLSLFALRTPPFVGREEVRDELWEALRAVNAEQIPRAIVLEGHAGTGKSRLAEWMGERASELGAATLLVASHDSKAGMGAGLGTMVAKHLECFGLSSSDLANRLRECWVSHGRLDHLALHDVRVLSNYMPLESNTARESGIAVTMEDPLPTFERTLRMFAQERPVYLWLDDVQWDDMSLDLIEHLLTLQDLPVFIVATVQRESLERSGRGPRIDEIARGERARKITVGPLEGAAQRALIGQMLNLTDDTVQELARRAGGNPLFAVQLVDECVDRGALRERGGRLGLAAGEALALPADVGEAWLQRVTHAVANLEEVDRPVVWETLELAAALGEDIDDAQWRHACNLADLPIDERLFERLLDSNLLTRLEGRWSFVHSTLRAVLEERARTGGRWRRVCQVCAESVRWFGGRAFGELERRRAEYFLLAGSNHSALTPMLDAARLKLEAGRGPESKRLRERHIALCDDLELDEQDEQRIGNRLVHAQASLLDGDVDEAVAWGRIALSGARAGGDSSLLASSLRVRAEVMRHRDMDEAVRAYDEAISLLTGDEKTRAMIAGARTRCCHPDVERAMELAEQVMACAPVEFEPHANWVSGLAARQTGELEQARARFEHANKLAAQTGRTLLVSQCEIELSRVARRAGQPRVAERWALRARNTVRAYGPRVTALADLELALASSSWTEDGQVAASIEKALMSTGLLPTDVAGAEARMVVAALAAKRGDVDAFQRWASEGRAAVEAGAFDRCLARALDAAADAAAEGGRLDLANSLWSLGEMQWRRLGTKTVSPLK